MFLLPITNGMQHCDILGEQENEREAKYGKEHVEEQMIYGKRTEVGSNGDKKVDSKDALIVEWDSAKRHSCTEHG